MKLTYPIQLLFLISLILSSFWYVGSALTGMLLIIALVVSGKSISTSQLFQSYSLSKLMLVYLAWLFVVVFFSAVPNKSMLTLAVLAGLPIMYLVASNTPNLSEIWKKFRILNFATGAIFAVWAIWQVLNQIGYGWASGPLVDRNAFAALMNLLWFPAAYLFLSNKSTANFKLLLMLGIGLFLMSTALFATASRGGIGVWLLLLPFLLWAGYRCNKSKQQVAIIVFIVIAAYFTSALLLNSSLNDRVLLPAELAQDPSANARLLMWQSTIQMASDHPLVGTGWGTFQAYYPAYRLPIENSTSGVAAHNDYLQLAAEGGIPALLLQLGILLGLMLQLKKSLHQSTSQAGLESTALLLGVLAIFIHAVVNFVFVFAFINILAGLYLARAAQLIDKPQAIKIPSYEQIRPSVKRLLVGLIVVIVSMPFALHLLAQACLTGSQPGLKAINLIAPKVTTYQIASFITAIRPQQFMAQETMLQTAEQFLAANINNDAIADSLKREVLNETIERFELLRAISANNPNIGVREAKMLIAHHKMLGSDTSYAKAQQVITDSLKADPYHANSMIMLARLHVAQGKKAQAIESLQLAQKHILTKRDQQLIVIETLRQLAAPNVIAELDEIEKQLSLVRSDSETGKPLILPSNFTKDIDDKLTVIENQIQIAQ